MELIAVDDFITSYYQALPNGFYQNCYHTEEERLALKAYFERVGFSALQFTDSRSLFQFYPLDRLWGDLQIVLKNNIKLVNIVTEPVTAGEVYAMLTGKTFINELAKEPARYDIQSRFTGAFGSRTHYMLDKSFVLADIRKFVEATDTVTHSR